MKKAIETLENTIRTYKSISETYDYNPHNQAVTEYTANEAKNNIVDLKKAVEVLKLFEKTDTSHNNDCTVAQSKIAPPKLKKLQEILHDYKNEAYGHETFNITVSELQSFFNFVQS
jgi:hypothetical protein